MDELTGLQRDIIHVISGTEDATGIDIKEELEDYHGRDLSTKLLPNVNETIETGYVQKEWYSKRIPIYSLTQKGKKALNNRIEWENNSR